MHYDDLISKLITVKIHTSPSDISIGDISIMKSEKYPFCHYTKAISGLVLSLEVHRSLLSLFSLVNAVYRA